MEVWYGVEEAKRERKEDLMSRFLKSNITRFRTEIRHLKLEFKGWFRRVVDGSVVDTIE